MALAGTLIVDIAANTARLQQDMAQAKGIVASAAKDIERSVGLAKAALGALGVAMSAGAVVGMTRDIVHATAALDDMAEVTGTSVQNLSRLMSVAKIGGHDFSLIEDSLVKLTKGLKGTEDETKGAASALQYLGIQAKDASGRLRDPGELVQEIAKKLGGFEDGAGKTALALDLFGKSGAKLLPFLKDMVELGGGVAKVTAEQAAAAEQLEKNWKRLASAGDAWKKDFVMGALPLMTELTEKMVDAQKAAGGLAAALLQVTLTDTANPRQRIGEIDRELGDIDKTEPPEWLPGSGLVRGALDVKRSFLNRQRQFLLYTEQRNAEKAGADPANFDARDRRLRDKQVVSYTGAKPSAAGGATGPDDGANLILGLRDQLQQASGEASVFDSVMRKLTEGTKTYAADTVATALALAGEVDEMKKARAEQDRLQKLNDERLQTQFRAVEASDQEIARLREQNDEIGLNAQQLGALRVARLDDAIAIKERQAANASAYETDAAYIETLRLQADQLRTIRDLTRDGVAKTATAEAAKEAEATQKRLLDNLERGLTEATIDGLAGGFRRGESIVGNFLRTAQGMFKSAVLTPIIQPILRPVAGAISGAMGGLLGVPGVANAGSALGGLGGGFGGGGFNPMNLLGQTGADFGNFFGSIGQITEMGDVFGLSDALMGFAGANPLTAVGLGLGAMGLLGGLFGGGGGPKASDVGLIRGSQGELAFTQNNVTDSGWGEAYASQFGLRYMALSPQAKAMLEPLAGQSFGSGGPTSAQSLVQQYIEPMLQRAEAFDATKAQREAAERAAQTQLLSRMLEQETQINAAMGDLATQSREQLGIGTLRAAIDELARSEYVSPQARFAAARAQLQAGYDAAIGGDLAAVQSFPGVLQNALGIGRDVYASGPAFAEIFSTGNRMLNDLLARQQATQDEMMRQLPAAVIESGRDTVAAIRQQTQALADSLAAVKSEIVRLQAAIG